MGIWNRLRKGIDSFRGSRLRLMLGLGIEIWDGETWYDRNSLANLSNSPLPDSYTPDFADENGKLSRKDLLQLQRNGKKALSMRNYEDLPEYIRQKFDQRREWNRENRPTRNVLELCFPSYQYSNTPLPAAYQKGMVDIAVSEKGRARTVNVARSHSIWLDPVDAPKELFKYKLRINRLINWAYRKKLVPIMCTMTIYHRWHHLHELIRILRESWKDLTSNSAGRKRFAAAEVKGWVRRLEITLNDGDETDTNAGWHPHYHVIILVPKDKLQYLSDIEQEWRDAWVDAVCKHFKKILGEEIDKSFIPAFRKHGLIFSRYNKGAFKGQLRSVDSGDYLAKLIGVDKPEVFGGDSEMSTASTIKNSRIPFDLLRDATLPAANVDLWVEYAFATKGVPAFNFAHGLEKEINAYFNEHPEHDKSSYKSCPAETLVASISTDVYQLLYRNFKLNELRDNAAKGYDSLCNWLRQTYADLGVPELATVPYAMPIRPPNST